MNSVRFVEIVKYGYYLEVSQLVVRNSKGVNIYKNKPISAKSCSDDTSPKKIVDGKEISKKYPDLYHSKGNQHESLFIDLGEDSDF